MEAINGKKREVSGIHGRVTSSIRGKSAYDLAVDNGFQGTVEQWLDSLSVKVREVQHSEEDEGINVIRFTDDSELQVKNGSKGSPGMRAWIAYSSSPNGSNFSEEPDFSKFYIGFSVAEKKPTAKEDYQWIYVQGPPGEGVGLAGKAVCDGISIDENGAFWIGTYRADSREKRFYRQENTPLYWPIEDVMRDASYMLLVLSGTKEGKNIYWRKLCDTMDPATNAWLEWGVLKDHERSDEFAPLLYWKNTGFTPLLPIADGVGFQLSEEVFDLVFPRDKEGNYLSPLFNKMIVLGYVLPEYDEVW